MQLELPWRDLSSLENELRDRSGVSIRVHVTDNASTVLSCKPRPDRGDVILRLHHMFLTADHKVLAALASWVKRPRRGPAATLLDRFIRDHRHLVRKGAPRATRLRSRGRHFDLQDLLDQVNEDQFGGSVTAAITWGKAPSRRRRRSIRFGTFFFDKNLIRIHPALDQAFVPAHFVRYIVFHEMLHAAVGVNQTASGRRRYHSAEFRQRERRYPDYDRAVAWQSNPANLRRLLRA